MAKTTRKSAVTPAVPYPQNLELLALAKSVLADAKETRTTMARQYKKGNTYREAQVQLAMNRIAAVMAEVRRETCRLAFQRPKGIEDYVAEVRGVSAGLQREKRKLWKMQWRPIDALDWQGPPPMVVVEQEEFDRLVKAAKKGGYVPLKEVLAATSVAA